MDKIIKHIHNSDTKLMLVEVGAGTPISQKLFSVSGASNTIYSVESPYSREAFNIKYGISNNRAVSAERLNSIKNYYTEDLNSNKFNTLMCTTFQIGDMKNETSTHGWIMLSINEKSTKYYHISIHESMSRKKYIDYIGKIGILLLDSKNEIIPNDCCVDIVLNENLEYDKETTLKFINNSKKIECVSVFTKDGTIDRLESITRTADKLIYYKGSFNPIQKAHIEVMKVCKKLHNDAYCMFAISLDTFQKGNQTIESIINRIEYINNMGYDVIILKNPLFIQNVKFLRNKYKSKIILPMGLDTINRLVLDYINDNKLNTNDLILDFVNCQIICLNRTGNEKNDLLLSTNIEIIKYVENFFHEISSTDVRKYLQDKNYDAVKKLIPNEIYQKVIDSFK